MKRPDARYLPLIIVPAMMCAILLPTLLHRHVPDNIVGGTLGILIGLAILGLIRMKKRKDGRPTPG